MSSVVLLAVGIQFDTTHQPIPAVFIYPCEIHAEKTANQKGEERQGGEPARGCYVQRPPRLGA